VVILAYPSCLRHFRAGFGFDRVFAVRIVWAAALAMSCMAAGVDDQDFNGRWDIAVNSSEPRARAWWLEVAGAGTPGVKGKFVGAPGGQIDDIPRISISGGELRFVLEKRYQRDQRALLKGMYWARLEDGKLKGTFEIVGDPSSYLEWTGTRAPVLPEKDDPGLKKGDPVTLFDGHDLSAWLPASRTGWTVKDTFMGNSAGAVNLVSEKKFWNFVLHADFRVGQRGISGIGLRGRYKIQIADDYDRPPSLNTTGAVNGRIAPFVNAARPPGEWQNIEIRLVGRQVSVTLNNVKVIEKQTIDGLTAIASDANEAEPGPIVLQGDRGPVEFRRVVVTPLTKPK
jgi:hypothetical protein